MPKRCAVTTRLGGSSRRVHFSVQRTVDENRARVKTAEHPSALAAAVGQRIDEVLVTRGSRLR